MLRTGPGTQPHSSSFTESKSLTHALGLECTAVSPWARLVHKGTGEMVGKPLQRTPWGGVAADGMVLSEAQEADCGGRWGGCPVLATQGIQRPTQVENPSLVTPSPLSVTHFFPIPLS